MLLNERRNHPPPPKIPEYETFDAATVQNWPVRPVRPILGSKRSGVLAYKMGMIGLYDGWGLRHTLTVCHVDRLRVVGKRTIQSHGYSAVQLGLGYKPVQRHRKSLIGLYMKADVGPKDHLHEFRVTPDCVMDVGTEISVRHFVPGQWCFISGMSKAKGWKGPMQRWGFSGLDKDHGVSKAHRSHGSVGIEAVQRVYKGKKMAGHHGPDPRCMNCKVFRICAHRNLIFLYGSVPGRKGALVKISDARGTTSLKNAHIRLPYPTFVPVADVKYPVTVDKPLNTKDPFLFEDRPYFQKSERTK